VAEKWHNELLEVGAPDIEVIAARERCSVRKINMTISLAFLAPDLVKAAIHGRLPRGIGIARLCDLPIEWSKQYRALGPFRILITATAEQTIARLSRLEPVSS
jgi:site-specific DNA recombinase